jgi:hypothetical protein
MTESISSLLFEHFLNGLLHFDLYKSGLDAKHRIVAAWSPTCITKLRADIPCTLLQTLFFQQIRVPPLIYL